eukprot:CAMPEP_0115670406 /NCGR_PEP_ID=MMETSP0272-20121206/51509_1 /TAXON_ID=71861 /ORGANISM="Scrippsiella trochoidea, Strain CCMP3099" /LENGTH=184 /DNA_ID=CAMNT_0003109123 /DNA_START=75 /DNA_END=626 /DNA_ORIENTATION=+
MHSRITFPASSSSKASHSPSLATTSAWPPDDAAVAHDAAVLDDPPGLGRVAGSVIYGDPARGCGSNQYSAGVTDVGDVERQGGPLSVRQSDSGGASAVPCAQHRQLTVDPPEGLHQSAAGVPRPRGLTPELCQDHLMQLRLAVLHLLPPAVAIVHSEEAPNVFALPSTLQEGVQDPVAVLHVRA